MNRDRTQSPSSAAPRIEDPFASRRRPVLAGSLGAVSAAHPLAVGAGQEMLLAGGSAVDAVIAAQAVLCVIAPDACGLGGDALCLVREPGGACVAVNGAGASPAALVDATQDGGASITVPGIVDAWDCMSERWGRLPFARLLAPATRLARGGFRVPWRLAASAAEQRHRLVNRQGGCLSHDDLIAHRTVFAAPVEIAWRGQRVSVQPPMTQGLLLAMALKRLEGLGPLAPDRIDHAGIELTEAAFAYRDRVGEGIPLLDEALTVNLERAQGRGGPRAYLHTAGVAVADRDAMTVSSLVSVFDDFGSAVFVPQGGFVLNNRAGGFTAPPNQAAGGKRPVHTLAPVLVETAEGPLAFATPGADGQVQTLLQVLSRIFVGGEDLAGAIEAPRWRSEDGRLLVEASHERIAALGSLGHDVVLLEDGHMKFGAVVSAGHLGGRLICAADWRRETWAGVV